MRKKFLQGCFSQAILAGLLAVMPSVFAAPCGTTVNWHNLSDTSCPALTSSGVLTNVVNQNIDIIGTNALVEGIHVNATTCDILITVTNGDAVITGTGNRCDGVLSDPARLYLFADVGRTITFRLVNNLEFTGAADGATLHALLVTVTGGGDVIFDIDGGSHVSFTQGSPAKGGTQFYVGMGDIPNDPLVQFRASLVNPTVPFTVNVGPHSIMSYIANEFNTTAIGAIEFSPANNASINAILNIENTGAVIIGGHAVTGLGLNNPNLMISDIDLAIQAGGQAIFEIDNSLLTPGNSGALQIINANNACTQLLSDPFCQQTDGQFTGVQTGFILVAPSVLNVANLTYLEYVGTATNICCFFTLLDDCGNPQPFERLRNGSAFIVDGVDNDIPATINLLGTSAIYFLSGVDNCGNVSRDFTIDPKLLTPCAGNIVLDVEGALNVVGTSSHTNAINILSLQVQPTGCPVTEESPLLLFPKRTFARDVNGVYLRYNSGAFLVNNRMNIINATLQHNDENHKVFEEFNLGNPNLGSEPTYVGGDSYLFFCHLGEPRPTIAFYNSAFRIQTSVASTGVDWLVPNLVGGNNISAFVFYNNGRCIDDGYGQNMILGTDICFENCITTTDMASHLNVFQEVADPNPGLLELFILTATNTNCTTEGITGDISGQFAVQTIYLNNETNISIGTNGATGVDEDGASFALTVTGQLLVDGACISFETRGGTLAYPASSATTGQGGIFVDRLGVFRVLHNRIANIGAMVAMSRGGIVDLPYNSVYFDPEIGIAQWNLDLTDPTQRVIIPAGQHLSDYTLDWGAAIKAYCCSSTVFTSTCFIPYELEETPAPCAAPAVTNNNLNALPTVKGDVDQLQILRARICDSANLLVDGGLVRELVFIHGFNSAEAPTAFVVLQNNGIVGLGTTHKDLDALQGSVVLGVNGVTLVPNGDGHVILNEDLIINNVCHILSGTAFGLNGQNVLTIDSTSPKELRIKAPGVLDLSQFTNSDQVLEITGQVRLVCEPGARIILGGGILRFSDQAQFYIEPVIAPVVGTTLHSTDNVRVVLSGLGTVQMTQAASMLVGVGAYFGVETFPTCTTNTNISFQLLDEACVQIGNAALPGGVFQVGDIDFNPGRSVSFQLFLQGPGATFNIDREGFFGLGVGIVNKPNTNPNDWSVTCLSNITTLSVLVEEGTFVHNKIFNGSDFNASLLAIGSQGLYTFLFNPLTSVILGGGNMVKINCSQIGLDAALRAVVPTSLTPTVSTFAGATGAFLISGMMAGEYLLVDPSKGAQPAGVSALNLFNYLKTDNYAGPSLTGLAPFRKRANYAPGMLNIAIAGFVSDGTLINRIEFQQGLLLGRQNDPTESTHSFQIGAVKITIDPDTDSLAIPSEIIGAATF
jgi:hypothetical protein